MAAGSVWSMKICLASRGIHGTKQSTALEAMIWRATTINPSPHCRARARRRPCKALATIFRRDATLKRRPKPTRRSKAPCPGLWLHLHNTRTPQTRCLRAPSERADSRACVAGRPFDGRGLLYEELPENQEFHHYLDPDCWLVTRPVRPPGAHPAADPECPTPPPTAPPLTLGTLCSISVCR